MAARVNDPALELKAKLFRGFADPSRLALLDALRQGERTVTELVAATGLSQPNASAHLACLRECGLVFAGKKAGSCTTTSPMGGPKSFFTKPTRSSRLSRSEFTPAFATTVQRK
jgi:DNA-binding transcriptional regulator GbsR (MarR family)